MKIYGGDVGSCSLSGIAELLSGTSVELRVSCDSTGKSITVVDAQFTLKQA